MGYHGFQDWIFEDPLAAKVPPALAGNTIPQRSQAYGKRVGSDDRAYGVSVGPPAFVFCHVGEPTPPFGLGLGLGSSEV